VKAAKLKTQEVEVVFAVAPVVALALAAGTR